MSIEAGGLVKVDGKPFFPIALYSSGAKPPSAFSYAEIAAAGFNVVTVPADRHALDEIQKNGLRGVVYLGGRLDLTQPSHKPFVESNVKMLADHPALLAWESINEPSWTYKNYTQNRVSAAGLTSGHQLLKSLDPAHVILATHSPHQLVKTIAAYSGGVDAISTAFYPIIPRDLPATYGRDSYGFHGDLPNQSPSGVGDYTDKTRRVAGSDRSVWTTIQAFSWTYGSQWQDKLPARFPTYEETRFMSFDAIIHGANGVLFWGTHHINNTFPFWRDLSRVAGELRDLSPVLLSKAEHSPVQIEYSEMGYSDETAIEFTERRHLDSHYFIAANRSLYPAKVTVRGLSLAGALSEVVSGSQERSIVVDAMSFTDTFAPLAVHVYRWKH